MPHCSSGLAIRPVCSGEHWWAARNLGGILLVLGLFTRFAAAAVLIFMIVAVKFTSAKGFFWSAGGYEYPLLIGLCALFFLIRGGGQCSLDRMIGREI